MDFFQPIDIYCERTDPSFWAEPVNAITNAAFLIAAYVLYRAYRQTYRPTGQRDWPSVVLVALIATIGIGSFLFHSFANNWSMLADVIPIALFIWFYLFAFLRRFVHTRPVTIILAYAAFSALNWAIARYVPGEMVNNSQPYFPALIAMVVMGGFLFWRKVSTWRYYALAVMAFTASLIFRVLDPLVCADIALGTHFMWHVLNAVTLYLVARAVMPIRAGT
jgi:hypothetical protein